MEQLVARRAHNPKVVGSSPAPATSSKKPQVGRFEAFLRLVYWCGNNTGRRLISTTP